MYIDKKWKLIRCKRYCFTEIFFNEEELVIIL